jgi:hypothetical protein
MKTLNLSKIVAALIKGSAILTTLGFTATALGCDNGTTSTPAETAQNFPIAMYSGKEISIYGLPSLVNPVKDKITTAVEDILDDSDGNSTTFKNIVASHGLKIIIENGEIPGPIFDGNNGILKFNYAYVLDASTSSGVIKNGILYGVINNMVARLFNNAKETVRMVFTKAAYLTV